MDRGVLGTACVCMLGASGSILFSHHFTSNPNSVFGSSSSAPTFLWGFNSFSKSSADRCFQRASYLSLLLPSCDWRSHCDGIYHNEWIWRDLRWNQVSCIFHDCIASGHRWLRHLVIHFLLHCTIITDLKQLLICVLIPLLKYVYLIRNHIY